MNELSGLGKIERRRLTDVFRRTKGTISVTEVANILTVSQSDAGKMLARWAMKGWVSRVRRGLYIPVSLKSLTSDIPLEDPWLIAERLYTPCYIGGWSAAEYWGLTEQIFNTIIVITTRKPRERMLIIKGVKYVIRTASDKLMFGLKSIWRDQVKINVSDPSRTVIDMLNDPRLGGGLRPTVDVLRRYLQSKYKDSNQLIRYGRILGNGAVFKRLGFLVEQMNPDEKDIISACIEKLTQGYAKLDPTLQSNKIVTRWKLWVPGHYKEGQKG